MKLKYKLNDNIITMATITGVNALNYGLNLILGRWLGPQGFSEANILATLVLMLSFIGVTIQMSMAHEIAHISSDKSRIQYYRSFYRLILKASIIFSLILIAFCVPISEYLKLSSPTTILLIMAGVPFYFALSAKRGYFQGIQDFKKFSITFVIESFSRMIITIIGVYVLLKINESMVIYAIAIGFLVSFVASSYYGLSRVKQNNPNDRMKLNSKRILFFLLAISLYELSQILINNFDVILVKHYFNNFEAGLYASVALIGRIVYFGTWTIVTLLFPKVIEKERKGESHTGLFYGSLAVVFSCGLMVILLSVFQGDLIIQILFGNDYVFASPLLWKYALSTTIFATANVFAYYYMSLKKYFPIIISLFAGFIQIGMIVIMHASLNQIIIVQIMIMSSLLVCMLIYHFYQSNTILLLNLKLRKA